ncbi:flagellar motor switch protein FliY [Helicobacter kayseriensis]|uniref:flagellar motor switch protein FliY n=1 Tax=Helicobacter kayseriensis TaxID=2905877 RepID=UPI001E3A4C10|nr:flagellar motor switch protein FliY [Helicobacter kayseriensis]MCE3046916.1 flagellar motor switch protein FliY [Helicobacter kayseriensis]MCE3048424.1 flagellar motor switch protein FliY [Helicobacter kayseriensis]
MVSEIIRRFVNLFVQESSATLEGLLGVKPEISYKDVVNVDDETIKPPFVLIRIRCKSENREGNAAMTIPSLLASHLSALMVGEEPQENKEHLSDDDLDATKEIANNILGALSTGLDADKLLPSMRFEILEVKEIRDQVDLSDFVRAWSYEISINGLHSQLINFGSLEFIQLFQTETEKEDKNLQENSQNDDLKNISMLLDVKINVHVRIGQKKMLLKDVIAMDIGSVIELNQLANEPLEVLVDDKVIAHGEVVIVDGNFGIQITDIGSKKERLEQIKV